MISRPGATPIKIFDYITKSHDALLYKVIVFHIGKNLLRQKNEWALYLHKVNGMALLPSWMISQTLSVSSNH